MVWIRSVCSSIMRAYSFLSLFIVPSILYFSSTIYLMLSSNVKILQLSWLIDLSFSLRRLEVFFSFRSLSFRCSENLPSLSTSISFILFSCKIFSSFNPSIWAISYLFSFDNSFLYFSKSAWISYISFWCFSFIDSIYALWSFSRSSFYFWKETESFSYSASGN